MRIYNRINIAIFKSTLIKILKKLNMLEKNVQIVKRKNYKKNIIGI